MTGERVFLSHAWVDRSPERVAGDPKRALAAMLRDHLSARGLTVFYDENAIEDLDAIADRIQRGLADACLFVCWYSDRYRTRRACDWELMTAITADPDRIVVVNPEPGTGHILPVRLRDTRLPSVPDEDDRGAWSALADRIAQRAAAVGGTFGNLQRSSASRWYGDAPTRFSRFVGRDEALWELDGLLRPATPASGGSPAPSAVVVHGYGGVGKTALAREYAMRFSAAYPGGIFWLRATTPGAAGPETQPEYLAAARATQLVDIARQLSDAPPSGDGTPLDPVMAVHVIRRHLQGHPAASLWVVDDLPEGLAAAEVGQWLPPEQSSRAVITTRGTTYRSYPNLALDVMTAEKSVDLLLSQVPAPSAADRVAATTLAERLGRLPLALDVVGALAALPGSSPAGLAAEEEQALALVEEAAANPFAAVSPTEHQLSVGSTFGASIRRLDDASFGLLAAASAVNVGPLPVSVVRPVAHHAADVDPARFRAALGTLLSRSLARSIDAEAFEVHSLSNGTYDAQTGQLTPPPGGDIEYEVVDYRAT